LLDMLKWSARFPSVVVATGLIIVGILLSVGCALAPMTIDSGFDGFLKSDVPSSVTYDIYKAAQSARTTGKTAGRRLEDTPKNIFVTKEVALVYQLREGGVGNGILHDVALHEIATFERELRSIEGWQTLCGEVYADSRPLCSPGVSFSSYANSGQGTNLTLDGTGDAVPIAAALLLVERHGVKDILFPEGFRAASPYHATALRSVFRFTIPCCSSTDALLARQTSQQALERRWEDFLERGLLPKLRAGVSVPEGTESAVEVLYDGSGVMSLEVLEALAHDMVFAILSALFVIGYMVFHTQSVLLSCVGLLIALLSVPLAYLTCAIFGASSVSIASFLAVFLVVGFGCDTIFIFSDFWHASEKECSTPEQRLVWTFLRAMAASGPTMCTTSLSFLANMASALRALRQFGVFMGLCVVFTWLLIATIFLPLCLVDERCNVACRRMLRCRWRCRATWARVGLGWAAFVKHLHRFRCIYFVVPVVIAAVGACVAAPMMKWTSDFPDLLPREHVRNRMVQAEAAFASRAATLGRTYAPAPLRDVLCSIEEGSKDMCAYAHCDDAEPVALSASSTAANTTSCPCRRRAVPTPCPSRRDHMVSIRISVPGEFVSSLQTLAIGNAYSSLRNGSSHRPRDPPAPPLLLSEWLSGAYELVNGVDLEVIQDTAPLCGYQDVCFCAKYACKLDGGEGWFKLSDFQVPSTLLLGGAGTRRLLQDVRGPSDVEVVPYAPGMGPARRLATAATVKSFVSIVFGLSFDLNMPLLASFNPEDAWRFNPSFDLADPWTQRHIAGLCEEFDREEVKKDLKLVVQSCWIQKFEECQDVSGERFPALAVDFHQAALRCGAASEKYLWLSGDEVGAMTLVTNVAVSETASDEAILELKAKWEAFLSQAPAFKLPGTFHVSPLWVKPESAKELVKGTVTTVLILLAFTFVVMLGFTGSLALSFYVGFATLAVLAYLMAWCLVVLNWTVGLLEAIALIYFVGYAVTFPLHVAHLYGEKLDGLRVPHLPADDESLSMARLKRTSNALMGIGCATVGSGITTAGAAFFLLFCSLTIFQRLGAMCLVVTMASIFVALILLPAALLTFGPRRPGSCSPRRMGCCRRGGGREGGSIGVSAGAAAAAPGSPSRSGLRRLATSSLETSGSPSARTRAV